MANSDCDVLQIFLFNEEQLSHFAQEKRQRFCGLDGSSQFLLLLLNFIKTIAY